MEINKPEVAAILAAVSQVDGAIKELNDLDLTMVGGGVGEVILG